MSSSWADDEDDVPCAPVPQIQRPTASVATQPRPSLLAPSLPDRDSRDSRTPRAAAPAHSRAPDLPKSKGVQGQRADIARLQQQLNVGTGPVSTLADRMGANPWSKVSAPATPNGNSAAAGSTPRQSHVATEPQRKPLVLAPRTQPLAASDPGSAAVSTPSDAAAAGTSGSANTSSKPSTPKSDPFGGARPVDTTKAAEIRQKLLEEKAQKEAMRRAEVQSAQEKSAKQESDKESSRHNQDERPSSARGGWGSNRGRSGDRASSDTVEVKILQRSVEKLAISQPPSPAVVQSVDSPASTSNARQFQGAQSAPGPGKGAKASTPREPKRTDPDHPAPASSAHPAPPSKHHPDASADGSGRSKGLPQSPKLAPASDNSVIAAASASDGTPSNRGKSKRKDGAVKGKHADDLPLPYDK